MRRRLSRFRVYGLAGALGLALAAGAAGLARAEATAPAGATARATVPLGALSAAVAAYVAEALDAPLVAELPRVEFAEPGRVQALRYGGAEPDAPMALSVLAVYDDRARIVTLQQGWDAADPVALSILVHEMVHHAQNLSGRRYDCAGAREAEAYAVQERWLALHGRSLEVEFEINPLTRFVLTTCAR
jgi:hypothetical protein